jgi:hypothetical protein
MLIVRATPQFPSILAQNIGRELYHGRQDVVQIVGDKNSLRHIAWIFKKVPDMFELQCENSSLLVRRAESDGETPEDQLQTHIRGF